MGFFQKRQGKSSSHLQPKWSAKEQIDKRSWIFNLTNPFLWRRSSILTPSHNFSLERSMLAHSVNSFEIHLRSSGLSQKNGLFASSKFSSNSAANVGNSRIVTYCKRSVKDPFDRLAGETVANASSNANGST